MAYTEAQMQVAIAEFKAGKFKSERAATQAHRVPRTTFKARLRGQLNQHLSSHVTQQRLSQVQENFLEAWVLDEDARGYPPSHARVREMAVQMLRHNGDHKPLGKRWISSFTTRHPRVASMIGRRIEAARIQHTTCVEIRAFFDRFQRTISEHDIQLEDIWNMDEHGIALGVCVNTRVLASLNKKRAYVTAPQGREWVSIVEVVSTTGKKCRPVIIFKGMSLLSS